MKKNVQSETNNRQQKQDSLAYLTTRVRQIVSDTVKGKFNFQRQDNEPGTGRPWVQTKLIRVDGILGWSAIDAFDDQNVEFGELTDETVRIAHGLQCGIFATTQPLSSEQPRGEYLTHHVTNKHSLDRLKADLAEKFDLALVFLWEDQEISMCIQPNCRSFQTMAWAAGRGVQCVIRRLGTENDLRQAARFGFSLKSDRTRFRLRLTKEYIAYLEKEGQSFLRKYVAATFDNGIAWGWPLALRSDSESPSARLDMSPMFQADSPMLPFEETVAETFTVANFVTAEESTVETAAMQTV